MAGEQLLVQLVNMNKKTKIKPPRTVNSFMITPSR